MANQPTISNKIDPAVGGKRHDGNADNFAKHLFEFMNLHHYLLLD